MMVLVDILCEWMRVNDRVPIKLARIFAVRKSRISEYIDRATRCPVCNSIGRTTRTEAPEDGYRRRFHSCEFCGVFQSREKVDEEKHREYPETIEKPEKKPQAKSKRKKKARRKSES